MPRKIYDDEKLREEALKLRRQGLSYREIAEKLGCSVYKVYYDLIPDHESPSSRLKQAAELADRLSALEAQVSKLQSLLSNVKMLEDLAGEVSKLRKEVEGLDQRLKELADSISWIRSSAERRLRDDHNGCKWLDRSGYCTRWYLYEKVRGWDMRPDIVEGRTVYMLNVKKHPLICTACPYYEPRGL
jgi:transcriptional regulator with XRE-family HTH domain